VRPLSVVGLTSDGLRLVLRSGADTFELALRDVPTARQPALPFADGAPPTPREIQQRIRMGATAADIAEGSGLALEHVVRYEGPVIAEREHQAERVQRARVDGRLVGELVAEHMTRLAQDPALLVWDAWLVEPGRWEVRAQCGREAVRLRWEPADVKVQAIDEAARHALRLGPVSDDALGAVLRPVSGRPTPAAPATAGARKVTGRPKRAAVPAWGDITAGVAGRAPDAEAAPDA
jgi:hypothetical protein